MEQSKTAIAIQYDPQAQKAPKILAAGQGARAEEIVEVAKTHQVPVQKNSSLINSMAVLNCKAEIPPELYDLVSEVLWFAHRLDETWKTKNGGVQ
ncbi:MAG: EscU/YscU/HrcU family type III secretion system export apparatus switch protein [Firmicutes bacterium]|nr:EscU/YscU/HrcU family type III secretion system export apparatus switch protein [Bacillota bacterium]